jgi:hypothetical protein
VVSSTVRGERRVSIGRPPHASQEILRLVTFESVEVEQYHDLLRSGGLSAVMNMDDVRDRTGSE